MNFSTLSTLSTTPKYLLFILIIASSCKQGWSGKDKKVFIEKCMDREIVNERTEKQDSVICDCLLQKTLAKYPEPKDTVKINYHEAIEWGAKCEGAE